MTKENKDEEIKLTPAEDSPWYKFYLAAESCNVPDLCEHDQSWLSGIYYLYMKAPKFPSFRMSEIKPIVPDGHWIKKTNPQDQYHPNVNHPYNQPLDEHEEHIAEEAQDKYFMDKAFILLAEYLNNLEDIQKVQKIDFSNLIFKEKVNFPEFVFPIEVSFENSVFSDGVDFKNTLFIKDADFTNTKFLQDVHFDDAIFFDTANFKGAEFYGETAKFRNTIFKKIADFTNAKFEAYANFKSAKLKGRTSFQKAKFKFHAPRFYGAEFNNEMTFFGMVPPKFVSIFPPKLIRTSDEKLDKSPKNIIAFWIDRKKKKKKYRQRIQENQNSYENTAILLEEKKKYHDQHFFFRQEMTCRRRIERRVAIRWAFWLYEKLANYGYGIDRALFWWATHMVFGVLVIATMYGDMQFYENLPCAISVSFANANPYAIFGFDSVKLAECYDMFNVQAPISFAIIKVIQTILGVAFLFLVLLTLRVRFRLK